VEKAIAGAGYERARIDISEQPAQKEKWHVESIPVVIVVGPDGKERARKVGYMAPEDMLTFLASASAKAAPAAP
jgi:hypothetical protein